eukprot:COSAG01_NODE_584_length_15174_cov_27.387901_8_plen_77_part_00
MIHAQLPCIHAVQHYPPARLAPVAGVPGGTQSRAEQRVNGRLSLASAQLHLGGEHVARDPPLRAQEAQQPPSLLHR